MGRTIPRARAGAVAVMIAVTVMPRHADAAGSAYVVDTAEVGEPGGCKLESWVSWASNRDIFAATSPACVVDVFRPVDVSVQFDRSRQDGAWSTNVTPKVKT